jgi:hypothetical protein
MNIRIVSVLTVLMVVVLIGGCVTHEGEVGWVDRAPELDHEYEIVRTVQGEGHATYIVGIGPAKMDPFARARTDLIEEADLDEGQRVINRTLDVEVSGFPPKVDSFLISPLFTMIRVYYRKSVYLSGEVIQKTD